jgi:cation diffusion facilitator family transporter
MPTSSYGYSLNLNDFIKNNYGAIQEREKEKASLLDGNPSGWHYNHHETGSVNTEESSIIQSIVSNGNNTNNSNYNNNYPETKKIGSWTLRKLALELSLWSNVFITLTKLVAYTQTLSLSVLAALLDSLLDVVSQLVLNYTEKHSSMQRSSALYPAGASRLEPIGVLTCASLMGMASFEVLKESFETLWLKDSSLVDMGIEEGFHAALSMAVIVVLKLLLLWLCNAASNNNNKRHTSSNGTNGNINSNSSVTSSSSVFIPLATTDGITNNEGAATTTKSLQLSSIDPTLEAVAQDHWNDALSNGVSAIALLLVLYSKQLWWCDGVGAIFISIYIIHSWYHTGKEQIEHLTGKSAPSELIEELMDLAEHFDERLLVDTCRAYHFGPKFLVELEVVMPMDTLLKESHDLGMELQYEIEAREEVERCFVHIDYESRDYDEHVVSKVPELREHLLRHRTNKAFKNSAMSV